MMIMIHRVVSIEMIDHYPENCNQRTVRIRTRGGETHEMVLFGDTGALDSLPKSNEFRVLSKEKYNES